MATFCIPKAGVEKFTQALRSGKIDPYKLNQMTSDERRTVFSDIAGEKGAKQINSEFEKRMLLKNQKTAYTSWAKDVAGLTEQTRKDLVGKIQKLDAVLNPNDEKAFLKDLASTKLGVNVSHDEAKQITQYAQKVQEAEIKPRSSLEDAAKKGWEPTTNDLDYGHARYDLENFVGDLKGKPRALELKEFKEHPLQASKKLPRAVADVTKSIGASLDDSFALRQGSKAFFTNNRLWQKQFKQSFINLVKGAKNFKEAEREINSRLMADPYYDQAIKDGLAIRNIRGVDDVFPTSAPGRIPVLGRAFNASEVAYSAFADNLRIGIYKQQLKQAANLGETLPTDIRKNIAKEVNSLTGRGGFGKGEAVADKLNIAFYSARFLKSNIDTMFLHPAGIGVGGIGSQAQKTAAVNLLKIIGGTATVLALAHKLKPGSVNFDPQSTNFGKIKIGSTTFDVSGGEASVLTLATRLAPLIGHFVDPKIKSYAISSSGNKSQINTGKFGAETGLDYLVDFFRGKTSPVGSVGLDVISGKNFNNKPATPKNEISNSGIPLNVQNYEQLKGSKNSANILASMLADTLGISTNTISPPTVKKNSLTLSPSGSKLLTKLNYSPTIAKSQRDIKLTPKQYSEVKKQTSSAFSKALAKAQKDPTFKKYTTAQKKTSLEQTLSKSKSAAVDRVLPQTKKGNAGYTQYENSKKTKAKNNKVKVYTSDAVDAPRQNDKATSPSQNNVQYNSGTSDPYLYTPVKGVNLSSLPKATDKNGNVYYKDSKGNTYIYKNGKNGQVMKVTLNPKARTRQGTPLLQIKQNRHTSQAKTASQTFNKPVPISA